jgi:signal transduction histidine kinase
MFTSLRFRLWLSYALLITTALGVLAAILFLRLLRNPFVYRQSLERLRAVQTLLNDGEGLFQSQSLARSAGRASKLFDVRILQYSRDGRILLDAYSGEAPRLDLPKRRTLLQAAPFVRDENGAAWLYTIERLPDDTLLMVAIPRPRVSAIGIFRDEFLPLIVQGGWIGLVLALVLAFLFARWVADPLQKILQAVRNMPGVGAGPVQVDGPQEVQELSRAFNSMLARVQASQQSQRDFVANVSHELKTPLTSIQGFSQSILDGTTSSPDQLKQAARVIYDESARMYRLVLDLLDLAKLDAGIAEMTMGPVNLSALLEAVIQRFHPLASSGRVHIDLQVQPGLPVIWGDGDRVSQVFTNLMDNALKFTPSGGRIVLAMSVRDGWACTAITDSGPGIPPQALDHIFERFYQADRARQGGRKHGAGLGLAIAREIVQVHGGRITVRSRPGEGTTFEVYLPLCTGAAPTLSRRK